MKVWTLFSRLLSICLIAGLLTAPVSAAPGADASGNSTMVGMAMGDMTGMDDMMPVPGQDCCRVPEQQLPDCQKSCPMVMGCLMKCFPSTSALSGLQLIISTPLMAVALVNDDPVKRLPGPLPYEPPRS